MEKIRQKKLWKKSRKKNPRKKSREKIVEKITKKKFVEKIKEKKIVETYGETRLKSLSIQKREIGLNWLNMFLYKNETYSPFKLDSKLTFSN